MSMRTGSAFLIAGMMLSACGGREAAPATDKAATAQADTTAAPEKTGAGTPGVGLANPANDARVVALVRPIVDGCKDKWNEKTGFVPCEAPLKAFDEAKLDKSDATCLNLLDDASARVRWLGARCLARRMAAFEHRRDKPFGQRLLAALKREKSDSIIDAQLANVLADKIEVPEMMDQLAAYAGEASTAIDVKALLAAFWTNERAYPIGKALAAEATPAALQAASDGYASHFKEHQAEACAFWLEHFEDADRSVLRSAVGHLTGSWMGNNVHDSQGDWYITGGGGGPDDSDSGEDWCPAATVDAALTVIERRMKAGTLEEDRYVDGLRNFVKSKHATLAQHRRAQALLQKIASTPKQALRVSALEALIKLDEKKGKAFAKRFAKDKEIGEDVQRLL